MDERNVFDLSPQMSRASQQVFKPHRLFLLAVLLAAMFAAAAIAG
jgi:hypothetical protein